MTKPQIARTIQIQLGGETLSCLQLPNGGYRIGASQLWDFFEIDNVQNNASRDCKRLLGKGYDNVISNVKTDVRPRAIPVLTLAAVGIVAAQLTAKGNKKALSFTIACAVEALERRLDAAVGKEVSEQERDIRFGGILSRHFWTDTIKWYIDTHDVSDQYKRFVYVNASDMLNRALFGMPAKEIREYLGLAKETPIRDVLPAETLQLIESLERTIAVKVKNTKEEPLESMRDYIWHLDIKPDRERLTKG